MQGLAQGHTASTGWSRKQHMNFLRPASVFSTSPTLLPRRVQPADPHIKQHGLLSICTCTGGGRRAKLGRVPTAEPEHVTYPLINGGKVGAQCQGHARSSVANTGSIIIESLFVSFGTIL